MDHDVIDDVLGPLHWDGDTGAWVGKVVLGNAEIGLICLCSKPEDFHARRDSFCGALLKVRENEATIRKRAAQDLLDVFNTEWNRDEDDQLKPEIDAASFLARMCPTDLCIDSDGRSDLYYKDGGLFLGHTIMITIDEFGIATEADIAG